MLIKVSALTLFLLLYYSIKLREVHSYLRYTNIKCTSYNKSLMEFSTCDLKVLGRNKISLNYYLKFYKLPVDNITINVGLYKKANGYSPFLYNITIDFCKFMENRKKMPIYNIVFASTKKCSNFGDKCPISHDIILKDCVLDKNMLKNIPLPRGEYMIYTRAAWYKNWIIDMRSYFFIGEDL